MPSASIAARCSADCGIQPPSAATTNSTAGTGPDPGQHVGHEPLVPGHVDEREPLRPDGSVIQAKPRSMVMPRRCSSAHRSGSIPVSARSSVGLAVIHVTGGGDDVHRLRPARRRMAACGSSQHGGGQLSSSAGSTARRSSSSLPSLDPADHGGSARRTTCGPRAAAAPAPRAG